MGWIECVRCEKFRCDFMVRTSALIAPFQPVLHRVSSSNELPNAPKHYETYQNMILGSNGVDRVCSLWKIPIRVCGRNFCTSSARFAPCFVRQPNGPQCTQIEQNAPKHQFSVQWGGSGAFVAKNSDATSCTNFCTSSARFAPSFITQPNGPQCTQIEQNTPKH